MSFPLPSVTLAWEPLCNLPPLHRPSTPEQRATPGQACAYRASISDQIHKFNFLFLNLILHFSFVFIIYMGSL